MVSSDPAGGSGARLARFGPELLDEWGARRLDPGGPGPLLDRSLGLARFKSGLQGQSACDRGGLLALLCSAAWGVCPASLFCCLQRPCRTCCIGPGSFTPNHHHHPTPPRPARGLPSLLVAVCADPPPPCTLSRWSSKWISHSCWDPSGLSFFWKRGRLDGGCANRLRDGLHLPLSPTWLRLVVSISPFRAERAF